MALLGEERSASRVVRGSPTLAAAAVVDERCYVRLCGRFAATGRSRFGFPVAVGCSVGQAVSVRDECPVPVS
jgi:hypothetical protein